MEMRMKKQVLSPTVKYSEKADLGAQMLGIGSDGGQGLGGGAEENAVDVTFVLVSDGSNLCGNREDDMKIVRRENFGRSFFDPLRTSERLAFWAMTVAAAVVTGPLVITAVAPLKMTAESCRAAHLDRGHNAPLGRRHRRAMLFTIGFAVAAEDVRHFQLRAIHEDRWLEMLGWSGLNLHRNRARQQIKRARCGAHFAGRDAEIFCGGRQAAMAEQQLDGAHVGALLEKMDCERVSHGMRCDRFGNFANAVGLFTCSFNRVPGDMPAWHVAWKEPVLRPFHSPPVTQDL